MIVINDRFAVSQQVLPKHYHIINISQRTDINKLCAENMQNTRENSTNIIKLWHKWPLFMAPANIYFWTVFFINSFSICCQKNMESSQ